MEIEVATDPIVEKITFRPYISSLDGRRGFIKMENYTAVFKLWYSLKCLEFQRITS
jgi:hypothetical protein